MYRFRKAFLIASGLVSSPALAVDTTWQGPGADFNTGANWSVGVPGSTDTGIFAGASPTTVLVAAPNTVDALRFDTNGYALQFSGSGSLTAHTINGSSDFLLGSSTLTVGNNSFLDSLMSGGISGSGSLAATGTSTLTLTGTNTYTGGTSIAAATLQIGNGGTTGSIVGNVTNNGTLAFN